MVYGDKTNFEKKNKMHNKKAMETIVDDKHFKLNKISRFYVFEIELFLHCSFAQSERKGRWKYLYWCFITEIQLSSEQTMQ